MGASKGAPAGHVQFNSPLVLPETRERLELQSGLDPLHHTDANAVLGRDLVDPELALLQGSSNGHLDIGRDAWPSNWLAALGAVIPGPRDAGHDALLQNRALELCKDACNLKHRLAHGRRGVEALRVQIEVDLACLDMPQEGAQILHGTRQPVDGPGHDNVKLPPRHSGVHGVKLRPLITTLERVTCGDPCLTNSRGCSASLMTIFLRCKIQTPVKSKTNRSAASLRISTRVSGLDLIEHQLSAQCLLSRLAFLALSPFQKFLEELLLALS